MPHAADVIIVGSGPAGVSAAFPLVEAGVTVLLLDGGKEPPVPALSSPYLLHRMEDAQQWHWMIGEEYYALSNAQASSPKLRVPSHAYAYEGFEAANRIDADDFFVIGSLARGGLSNIWGCTAARLSSQDLNDFPFSPNEIEPSYAAVAQRMGISGAVKDDLAEYFGLDAWAEAPIQIDALQHQILERYETRKSAAVALELRLGRARVAALAQDRKERKSCNLSGNCLWGCQRRSLYAATEDLQALTRYANFKYTPGFLVQRVLRTEESCAVEGYDPNGFQRLQAKKILLAAGTLATTRLALEAIHLETPIPMLCSPVAGFMLWLPNKLGCAQQAGFNLGQLAYAIELENGVRGSGSLFSTVGLPNAEFARYLPFRRRYGLELLKFLMSSCVLGNFYLPGRYCVPTLRLDSQGRLRIEGGDQTEADALMRSAERRLRKFFWKLGVLMLPKSFLLTPSGGSVHYASSLPMRAHPERGETNAWGELCGLAGVHVVDGASLSALSEKPHTVTIMANADRIGKKIAAELRG